MSDEFFTISELNGYIKDVINSGFPRSLWVCGEIQQYDRNKQKNHIFFELAEKDEASKDILARIGLVIFAGTKPKIAAALKLSENAFSLKDDIEVKFLCKVDFYAPHGAVRLIVEGIDPYYTLGKLAQEKQKLIAFLQKKGVFEKNKQLELPLVPLNIGLISSYDSAAYNDFCDELRKSGYGFKVYFQNALMQGKNAQKDIVKAIDRLTKEKSLDCLVITRGGGSLADLSCFDSQLIAEKIASLNIPVLTGIGHEINLSITDMAAHTYAKTPTAIAQFLIERIDQFISRLDDKLAAVINLAESKVTEEKQRIKNNVHKLHQQTMSYLKIHNQQLVRFEELIKNRPASLLKNNRQSLDRQQEMLIRAAIDQIKTGKVKLENYGRIIDAVHPVNTLKRGFSIARTKDGQVIKSIKGLKPKDNLVTEVVDGVIDSEIKKIGK